MTCDRLKTEKARLGTEAANLGPSLFPTGGEEQRKKDLAHVDGEIGHWQGLSEQEVPRVHERRRRGDRPDSPLLEVIPPRHLTNRPPPRNSAFATPLRERGHWHSAVIARKLRRASALK